MIFDVHVTVTSKKRSEYGFEDRNNIIKLQNKNIRLLQVKKDPIEDHLTTYSVFLQDVDRNIVSFFKDNEVEALVIRIGSAKNYSNVDNMNLLKLYLKPLIVDIDTSGQETQFINFNVKCVGLKNYQLLLDKNFSKKLTLTTDGNEDGNQIQFGTDSNMVSTKSPNIYTTVSNTGAIFTGPQSIGVNAFNTSIPLNTRLNNPGNLMTSTNQVGNVGTYSNTNGNYAVFATPEAGLYNSLKDIVAKYEGRTSHKTVNYPDGTSKKVDSYTNIKDLISIWSPPNAPGNSPETTTAYIQYVARAAGINENDTYTKADIPKIAQAMLYYESGSQKTKDIYNDSVFDTVGRMLMMDSNSLLSDSTYSGYFNPTSFSSGDNIVDSINRNVTSRTNLSSTGTESTYGSASLINPFEAKKSSEFLDHVANKLYAFYDIITIRDAYNSGGLSTFLYDKIEVPTSNVLDLLKTVYNDYPPFYLDNPWIMDDAYYTPDTRSEVDIGVTAFIPLNLMNVTALNGPNGSPNILSYFNEFYDSNNPIAFMNAGERTFFYKDYNAEQFRITRFLHKNLRDGVETIIKPLQDNITVKVPDEKGNNSGEIKLVEKTIKVNKQVLVEKNYDASEFDKRRVILDQHMSSEPKLVQMQFRTNDLEYFCFGKKYYLSPGTVGKDKPLTPIHMIYNYTNLEDKFELVQDILFYEGDVDLVSNA